MNKFICFILLTLMFSSSIAAQNFSIGGEIGVSSSRESRYAINEIDNRRNSFLLGINFNLKHSERLSFTSGVHYLRQGYQHTTCYFFPEGVDNLLIGKFDYLTTYLIVNFHFLEAKKLIANIGLVGAYNIKANQYYPERFGGCQIYYEEELMDTTKDLSVSSVAGIGYKIFDKKNQESFLMLRYIHGLSNNYTNPFGSSVEWKNNTFTLSYLHNFSIRGKRE